MTPTETVLVALFGGLVGWPGKVISDRIAGRELFDHRLRLEKEYAVYSELWAALFEFRRAAGTMESELARDGESPPQEEFVDAFNAYQAAIRRHEPFIHPSVYEPARKVVSLGREMMQRSRVSVPQSLASTFPKILAPRGRDFR
jgi:hypothetical protein